MAQIIPWQQCNSISNLSPLPFNFSQNSWILSVKNTFPGCSMFWVPESHRKRPPQTFLSGSHLPRSSQRALHSHVWATFILELFMDVAVSMIILGILRGQKLFHLFWYSSENWHGTFYLVGKIHSLSRKCPIAELLLLSWTPWIYPYALTTTKLQSNSWELQDMFYHI